MAYIAMSLTDPGSGYSVPIQPVDGVAAMSLDVQPSVRAVAEERAGGSGMVDSTVNLSAAAVTLALRLWPAGSGLLSPEDFLDQIGPLLNPGLRPALVVTNDRWAQDRQLTVRFDSKTAPVSDPTFTDVAISWKAPAGAWEAAAAASVTAQAFVTSTSGLTVDAAGLAVGTTGLVMPATSVPQPLQVISPGNMPSQWTAFLYGPCTAPKLANDATGLTLEFTPGLVLAAGEYVLVDSSARSALRNSDPNDPVLGSLNFATSDWWLMQPGPNLLRYYPQSAGAGSVAQLSYRPCWMP